jgi:hypothetical protein
MARRLTIQLHTRTLTHLADGLHLDQRRHAGIPADSPS